MTIFSTVQNSTSVDIALIVFVLLQILYDVHCMCVPGSISFRNTMPSVI